MPLRVRPLLTRSAALVPVTLMSPLTVTPTRLPVALSALTAITAPPLSVMTPPWMVPPARVTLREMSIVVACSVAPLEMVMGRAEFRLASLTTPAAAPMVIAGSPAAAEIVTESPAPGTTPPLQLRASLQVVPSPPPVHCTVARR